MRRAGLSSFLLCLTLSAAAFAATEMNVQTISIPTRDGKTLAADLWYLGETPAEKPVILIQTPYNRLLYRLGKVPSEGGGAGFPESPNYNYVIVDWRGFYGSSDAAVPAYDRGLDGYDCVEWIAAQDWCNGKVATWGSSALGFIQFQTARHQPPHLVCCVPRVKSLRNEYSMYYYGGVYRKEHIESMQSLGLASTALVLAHPTHDAYWTLLETNGIHADEIAVPMLVVGGWYDHMPDSVLETFEELRTQSAAAVRSKHRLIFGPWLHGNLGALDQGELQYADAVDYDLPRSLQFLDFHVLGADNGWDTEPVVHYYRLGEGGWEGADSWTGVARQTMYLNLHAGGKLDTRTPGSSAADTFNYDPDDPTPALGGSRFAALNDDIEEGPIDLAPIEARGDVLVYSTGVLNEPLRINGSVNVELQISSDRTDTDFCIRLTDVFPDGRSMLMTQGIRRARFRNSYETATLLTPNEITPVTVELQDLALTIQAGHRLRIVVCSADYPHFDRNLNDGGEMYVDGPGLVAANSIYHQPGAVSRVALQVLAPTAAPPAPANLSAAANGEHAIDLTWDDTAITETGFALEWSADGTSGWTLLANPAADAASYSDTGLDPGTTRFYRLRAVNGAGDSSNSNVASATTEGGNAAPTIDSGPDADPTDAFVGQLVAFSVAATDADGDALTIDWDFGDGESGLGTAPAHVFSAPGDYEVTVSASDGVNEPVTGTVTVHVTAAEATGPAALLVKAGKFAINWKAHELGLDADAFAVQGCLNPAGIEAVLDGAAFELSVNGTSLGVVPLEAGGKGATGNAKASLKTKTGAFAFAVKAADLRAALGLANADGSGNVELEIAVAVLGASLATDTASARAVFSFKTKAGAKSAGAFNLRKGALPDGVFFAAKTAAAEDKSGGHRVSVKGYLAAPGGGAVEPTGNVTLTLGAESISIPLSDLKSAGGMVVLGKGAHPALLKFVLDTKKKAFQIATAALPGTGVPPAGDPATAHDLLMRLAVPTAGGPLVFETTVEILRSAPTSTTWKR